MGNRLCPTNMWVNFMHRSPMLTCRGRDVVTGLQPYTSSSSSSSYSLAASSDLVEAFFLMRVGHSSSQLLINALTSASISTQAFAFTVIFFSAEAYATSRIK